MMGNERAWLLTVKLPSGLDGYDIHQAVWHDVADQRAHGERVLYREESDGAVMVLQASQPTERNGAEIVSATIYPPQLTDGDCVAFRLRVNPTVKIRMHEGRETVRQDVMTFAQRNGMNPVAAAKGWILSRQEKWGIETCEAMLKLSDVRRRTLRPQHRRNVILLTVDFEGEFVVRDAKRLRATILGGIGPAKGFGCGLLLVGQH